MNTHLTKQESQKHIINPHGFTQAGARGPGSIRCLRQHSPRAGFEKFDMPNFLSRWYWIGTLVLYPLFTISAPFAYDRALSHAHKGNWKQSHQQMQQVVVESPHNPEILYDAGVTAYKNNEYDNALSYFTKTSKTTSNRTLQDQADFNAGNALVQLRRLEDAIAAYDRVLERTPDHTQARHNKEVVKKMLEQQKQQEKNKQQQDQNNDQKQEQEKNNTNEQEDQNKNTSEQNNKQNAKDQQNNQDNNSNQHQEQTKSNSHEQKNKPSNEDMQKNGRQEQQESAHENGNKQNTPPQEQQKGSASGTAPSPAPDKKEVKLPHALAHLLEEQEKKDAAGNKQLIKAYTHSTRGRHDATHAW